MTHITETIAQLNARLAAGEITREALVTEAIDGAAQQNAAHVFTRLYPDAALAAARYADAAAAAGVVQDPPAGLPVSM